VCDSSLLVSKLSPLPPVARRVSGVRQASVDKLPSSLIDGESFIVVARPPIAPRNARRPVTVTRSRPAVVHMKSADLLSTEKRQLKKFVDASAKRIRSQSENNLHASPSKSECKGSYNAIHHSSGPSAEDAKAVKARQRRAIYALNKLMTQLENKQFEESLRTGCPKPAGV